MNLDLILGCFFGFGLGDPTKTFASGGAFSPGGPSGGSQRVLEVIFKRILGLHDVSSGASLGAPFFADRCGGDQRCYLGFAVDSHLFFVSLLQKLSLFEVFFAWFGLWECSSGSSRSVLVRFW